MVRVVQLDDGDYCVREILVCDAFDVALWSTEYMGCFGFDTVLSGAHSHTPSIVRTPRGLDIPLEHRPYRLHAPPRAPTDAEFSCGACTGEADGKVGALSAAASAGTAPRLVSVEEAWRLHATYMHAGWSTIERTCNVKIPPMPKCPVCELTMAKRLPQPGHTIVSTFAGQLTHSDTWGPFRSALYYKGCRYVVAFVDDYSRFKLAVFCKDRTTPTLLEAYKVWHAVMASMGCPPTGTWQSDGGPEYVSNEAWDFCDEHAINRLLSVRYVPTGNGVAESVFRVHVPRARAAVRACGAAKEMYACAIEHSVWLGNRTVSKMLGCAPLDRVPNPPPPSIHKARPFGCRMWALQPSVDVPDKMSDVAREGVFAGMSEVYKGYRCYYPLTHEFEPGGCIHAKFDPDVMPMLDMLPPPDPPAPLPEPVPLPPVHVPSADPLVAPVIPPVPLPQAWTDTPARSPMHATRAPGAVAPRFAPDGGDNASRVLLPAGAPPPPPVPPPPPPVPVPLPPVPPPPPPPPPVVLPPRRAGSRAMSDQRYGCAASSSSLAVVVAWLATTWHPPYAAVPAMASQPVGGNGSHVAVVIFSGVDSPFPECLRARGARVIAIDIAIGGRLHDLTDVTPDAIGWHLRRAAQRGEVQSLHAAVPCETFSVALSDHDMVRSCAKPMGLERLTLAKASKLCISNILVFYTCDLGMDVYNAGGEVTIENPSPRMDVALPHVYWPAKAHHANLFRTPPMLEFARATGSTEITFPLCACGMDMQKYVTILATKNAARVLAPLHGLQCTHEHHNEHAYGLTASGDRAALQSARYPYVFCVVLACAHLQLQPPGVDLTGASPLVVPVALSAVDRTGLPHLMTDTDHGVERSVTGWMFMFAGAAVSWAVRGQMLPSLSSAESELYGLSTGVCDLLTCVQVLEEMGFAFGVVTIATDSRGARLLAMDCAAAARTRHIHRRWYFVRHHIDEKHVRVVLIKGSANRSNFLTKAVGGAPFAADRTYALGGGAIAPPVRGKAADTEVAAVEACAAELKGSVRAAALVPVVDAYSAPLSSKPALRGWATRQADRVRAPGYVQPDGPGWWQVDDGDLSDEGDDVFSSGGAGAGEVCGATPDADGDVHQYWHVPALYQACVKVPIHACKAAVRTRFSKAPDGTTTRHDVPRGYDEAARHPESAAIWEAMIREMNAHEDCQTWTLRPASECYAAGKTPIDCMWVYDCKVDATTSAFLLWKARLVGRGDQMVYLRDYFETYSGVVRHATFRMFLAACAMLALIVTGADVSTAYLHAPLRGFEVWMKVPRGFPATIGGGPALCRLNMALYGLKQSAREWALTLIAWLVGWGFVQCTSDRYMFKFSSAHGTLILLIWVDDIFMGHDNDALRAAFMKAFAARFRVKDLGRLQQALGASISQSIEQGWVSFNVSKYIADLARRFNLHDNVAWADIPVPVALAKECRDAAPTDAEVIAIAAEYAVLSGSVTFVATFARPDVAYAAYLLATFMARPGKVHLKLARRVLGYLSRTRDLAIVYRKGGGDMNMSFSPLDHDVA